MPILAVSDVSGKESGGWIGFGLTLLDPVKYPESVQVSCVVG